MQDFFLRFVSYRKEDLNIISFLFLVKFKQSNLMGTHLTFHDNRHPKNQLGGILNPIN